MFRELKLVRGMRAGRAAALGGGFAPQDDRLEKPPAYAMYLYVGKVRVGPLSGNLWLLGGRLQQDIKREAPRPHGNLHGVPRHLRLAVESLRHLLL